MLSSNVYRTLHSILVGCILFIIPKQAHSQLKVDSVLSKFETGRFADALNKKASKIEHKLVHKSTKVLDKMQRQEEKLFVKMLKGKDSLFAKTQLNEVKQKYADLKDIMKRCMSSKQSVLSVREYFQGLS